MNNRSYHYFLQQLKNNTVLIPHLQLLTWQEHLSWAQKINKYLSVMKKILLAWQIKNLFLLAFV